ncbi:MAG: orotidine-5'-phosphate decarboxylase [Actinomycetota bacterium]|nr:orotidine-5'-phosphate decarboxylase [Actinomycetota bacterium]
MSRVEDPLIVALDTSDWFIMRRLADQLQSLVKTVKIGLEAFISLGPEVLEEMKQRGFKVFADLKLLDIPNTVQGAVKGLVERDVDMITLHAMGGRRMLMEAVEACGEQAVDKGIEPPLLLGVTVLTSLDEPELKDMGMETGMRELVLNLARVGLESGLDGVVASARESEVLRDEFGSDIVIVTPGIRLPDDSTQDQSRVETPSRALASGADYIVVGRTITAAGDPVSALAEVRRYQAFR